MKAGLAHTHTHGLYKTAASGAFDDMHFIEYCLFINHHTNRSPRVFFKIKNTTFGVQHQPHPCPDPSFHPGIYPAQSLTLGYFEARGGRRRRPDRALTLLQKIHMLLREDEFDYERFKEMTLKVDVVFIGSWKQSFGVIFDFVKSLPDFLFLIFCFHRCYLRCCRRRYCRHRSHQHQHQRHRPCHHRPCRHKFKIFPTFSFLEQPSLPRHQNRLVKIRCLTWFSLRTISPL